MLKLVRAARRHADVVAMTRNNAVAVATTSASTLTSNPTATTDVTVLRRRPYQSRLRLKAYLIAVRHHCELRCLLTAVRPEDVVVSEPFRVETSLPTKSIISLRRKRYLSNNSTSSHISKECDVSLNTLSHRNPLLAASFSRCTYHIAAILKASTSVDLRHSGRCRRLTRAFHPLRSDDMKCVIS